MPVPEQPDWKVGDWWIVKVRQPSLRAEPWPPWVNTSWKCEVVDIGKGDDKDCFVVRVASGDYTYGHMYFKKENLTLYKVPTMWDYFTKFNSDSAAPVISAVNGPFLYDFPAFPLEKNVTRTYGGIQQTVSVDTFTTEDGKTVECFKVVLRGLGHTVIQYWQPGLPWWIYEDRDGVEKAWLVDWGHEEVKKTSVSYNRTETPAPLSSTRTGGTKNYNIPTSGTAVKIPWSGYWWPLADRDIYGTDIINLYDNNRAMEL